MRSSISCCTSVTSCALLSLSYSPRSQYMSHHDSSIWVIYMSHLHETSWVIYTSHLHESSWCSDTTVVSASPTSNSQADRAWHGIHSQNWVITSYASWLTIPSCHGLSDGGMVILQLCHWNFYTKKLCSRLYLSEIEFLPKKKQKNRFFSATLWGI